MSAQSNLTKVANAKKLNAAHRQLYTEIVIDAPPELVWRVLCDTQSYKNWAKFLVGIQGEIKDSSTITAVFQIDPNKQKFTHIEHTINVTAGKEFYWSEKGPLGIHDNHHFRVEPMKDGKSRFIQSDELMRGATWLLGGYLTNIYLKGYSDFNRKLKNEVENICSQSIT